MRDKSGTIVTDFKKGSKESFFSNGMNPSSTSPGLRSPTTSGGSSSPPQESNEASINFKVRSESPHLMKNNDKSMNSASNCVPSILTNSIPPNIATTTSSKVASPISPGIVPVPRIKSPTQKQYKSRRNHSTEQRQKNTIFKFEPSRHDGQSSSENFCANNNNNTKHRDKSPFNLRRACLKSDDQTRTCRTPSTNSASDMSPSSLPTTEDHTNTTSTCEQNFDQIGGILGDEALFVDDKTMEQALNDIDVPGTNSALTLDDFPDPGGDLGLDGVTTSDFNATSEDFLFGGADVPRTSQGDLSSLDGATFAGGASPTSSTKVSSSSTVTTATCAVTKAMHGILTSSASSLGSSVSSPTYQPDTSGLPASTSPFHGKFSPPEGTNASNQSGKSQSGKSHLQDILGVTDTIRLQNMSRPIDSVAYKSPTTTSYSSNLKSHPNPVIPSSPCSMAPPPQHRLQPSMPYRPRQAFMYGDNPNVRPGIRGNVPPYMDMGTNWNRGSPVGTSPNQLRSPTFPPAFAEASASPGNVNPMSGLQSTVDSIPAAPLGTSEPSTPVMMGPPALRSPMSFDGTPPPGGRMRPPPSPSISDKRCVSADPVPPTTTAAGSKKSVNKRERTRSADSRDDDKKETSGPKTKRKKSRSKEDNSGGKKNEGKALTRTNSSKLESRLSESALGGLLDVQTNNPFLYIFNSEVANTATEAVNEKKVPDIILFHQSFLGNCKLGPSRPQSTTFERPSNTNAPPSVSMPTMTRSPTEIKAEKAETKMNKSPRTELPMPFSESTTTASINLQDSKPPPNLLPPITSDARLQNPDIFPPHPMMNQPLPLNGEQELTAEKRKHREDKLSKLQNMKEMLLKRDEPNGGNNMQRGPGWHGPQPPMNYPGGPDKMHPAMKEGIMSQEGMMPGQPMSQEHAEWLSLLQEYNVEKKRKEGELPTRPPPPYHINGTQQRWAVPEGFPMDPRLPPDGMNPRVQRIAHGPRPVRMAHDPRMPGAYHRLGMPRGPFPPNPRMPMYDPYMVQPGMMGPGGVRGPPISTRLPPSSIRQPGVNETYPFSEQLMKQASYYNREGGMAFEQEQAMMNEWPGNGGPDGTQRLSHMPGTTSPSVMGPNMMGGPNPMEMDARLTPVDPRVPNSRGYEMGPYHDSHRYDPCPLGSPTGPMDMRMRGPAGVGSMVDAMARRGGQRPPDLNLNSQLPPRSPMNYHVRGPLPSPNVMTPSMGPRYPTPADMSHPMQPSPIHGGPRSPLRSPPHPQYMPMGPTSAGVDQQPQVMLGAGPHSAGMMTNPPADWPGPMTNMPQGTPTSNPAMMHHMMTSQPGGPPSQPRMTSQPGVMTSEPMMMSPAGIPHQHMMNNRLPGTPANKHAPSTLSIMMNRMNTFKMPEKSPLYQDAVKDTASPPPLNHPEPPPLSHGSMPGGMRMGVPNHPPSYDSRMGPPRMGAPGPQMNDNFQSYPPGHPSPLQGPHVPGAGGMMNMQPDSMPPPDDYPGRPGFNDVQGFDLRGIFPSERPSQTISYLPPETNEPPYNPGWAGEGIRPQLMPAGPGPMYPPNRPLL